MKQRVINIALVSAALAVLGVLAFQVRLNPTADRVAMVKTAGMTCESCARKLEDSFRWLPGIAGVEVDVDGGWVVVGYDSHIAKPDTFAGVISRSGFGSRLVQTLSIDEFRRITGREFGTRIARSGCCGSAKQN